ncbi:MAG: DUF3006 domain-containing protein [Bacillota bacterium]
MPFTFICVCLVTCCALGLSAARNTGAEIPSGVSASEVDRATIRGVIDRVEGDMAILFLGDDEDCRVDIPVRHLPASVAEGAVIEIRFTCRPEETGLILQQMRSRLRDLR